MKKNSCVFCTQNGARARNQLKEASSKARCTLRTPHKIKRGGELGQQGAGVPSPDLTHRHPGFQHRPKTVSNEAELRQPRSPCKAIQCCRSPAAKRNGSVKGILLCLKDRFPRKPERNSSRGEEGSKVTWEVAVGCESCLGLALPVRKVPQPPKSVRSAVGEKGRGLSSRKRLATLPDSGLGLPRQQKA